jgi:DNA-directed RNA polymerase specialized sigma24 family protein
MTMTMTAATQLSRAQIDALFQKDGAGSRVARDAAKRLAKRRRINRSEVDDFAQDIQLHLFLALGRYDGSRGTLEAYIGEVVRRKVQTLLRDRWAGMSGQLRIASSLDFAVASGGDGRPVTLAETLSDDDDNRRIRRSPAAERRDQVINLEMVIATLSEDLRPICEGLKIYSKKKVEADAHLSPWRLNRCIGEIREAFEAAGLRAYHPSSASD